MVRIRQLWFFVTYHRILNQWHIFITDIAIILLVFTFKVFEFWLYVFIKISWPESLQRALFKTLCLHNTSLSLCSMILSPLETFSLPCLLWKKLKSMNFPSLGLCEKIFCVQFQSTEVHYSFLAVDFIHFPRTVISKPMFFIKLTYKAKGFLKAFSCIYAIKFCPFPLAKLPLCLHISYLISSSLPPI